MHPVKWMNGMNSRIKMRQVFVLRFERFRRDKIEIGNTVINL